MITASSYELLLKMYPAVEQGREDALGGRWTDLVGDYETMAYELGRALARSPPVPSNPPGFLSFDPEVQRIIKELVGDGA